MLQKFAEKIAKFTNTKYIRILTSGFMSIAAISICGSIFSLLKSLPIPGYETFLVSTGLGDILGIPIAVCTDVIAVYVALAMGHSVGKEFGRKDPFATALVGLGAFLVLTPFVANNIVFTDAGMEVTQVANALGTGVSGALGARGIFLALITGILGARLYVFLVDKKVRIKLPDSVPENVSGMFEMMIPGGLTFLVFLVIRWAFSLTSFGTAQTFIYTILQNPLMAVGGGLAGALIYVTVAKFLWCFGVHGGMICYSAMAAIMSVANSANMSALAQGVAIPNPEWALTTIMMDFGVLPLGICMLIFSRSTQYKTLSKVSMPTSIFNISEPQVFSLPIIMNPIIDIPFVLVQPINLLLTLGVMKLGLIALPTGAAVATVMPTPIALAIATGSISGLIWGVVLIALDVLIFFPFFKILDRQVLAKERINQEVAQ